MVPLIPAAPGLFGFGPATALSSLAGFLAAHPVMQRAFVLPIATARDAGDALLLGRILLLGGAGLAAAHLVRTLGLDRAALAGAALYELAAATNGTGDRQALAPLILAPLFVASVERTVRGLRPSTVRLAIVTSLVASLDTTQASRTLFAFGLAWAIIRISSPATVGRGPALARLAVGVLLGTLLASPFLLPHLPSTVASWSPPTWLDDLWPFRSSHRCASGRTLASLLPTIGLACLASVSARRRGRSLVVLLAVAALAIGSAPLVGSDALADGGLRPLFLTCLVMLCVVPTPQPRSRAALWTGCILMAAAGAAAILDPQPAATAIVNAVALIAVLLLSSRRRTRLARLGAIASAAWTAIAAAS